MTLSITDAKFKIVVVVMLIAFSFMVTYLEVQARTIHLFVALCDNEYQGIVPVPPILGNGMDLKNNLYWGAAYGVKTYFQNNNSEWKFLSAVKSENPAILERLLFKHISQDVYMLADAYDGEGIKTCIEDFLKATNGQNPV